MAKTDTSDTTTTDTDTATAGTGAAAAPAEGTPPPASLGATTSQPPPAPATEPTVHTVTRPLGMEFPVTDHESIAAKFGAKVEHLFYEIETDLENGVHRLRGWLKGSAA